MENQPADSAEPTWVWRGRVPSLDGLRGISVLMVVWYHVAIQNYQHWPRWVERFADVGDIGVDFFFVISGFLITLLLAREKQRSRRISIGRFYLRRVFRIIPAYAVCLVSVGLVLASTPLQFHFTQWLKIATFSVALFPLKNWYLAHAWSLSVEEQFYLLWPFLFTMLSRRILLTGCVAYSVGAVVLRAAFFHSGQTYLDVTYFSPTRGDAIAVGCAIGLIVTSSRVTTTTLLRYADVRLLTLSAVILVASEVLHGRYAYPLSVAYTMVFYRFVAEWCIAAIVISAVHHNGSWAGRLLNWRPLTSIGVLSYSIYLWQQAFLGPMQPNLLFRLPGNLLMIALVACASYFLIEQPFLRLKARFEATAEARQRSELEARQLTAS